MEHSECPINDIFKATENEHHVNRLQIYSSNTGYENDYIQKKPYSFGYFETKNTC